MFADNIFISHSPFPVVLCCGDQRVCGDMGAPEIIVSGYLCVLRFVISSLCERHSNSRQEVV